MLYERMLSNLQSKILSLLEQLKLKDNHFRDEISYLWKQLEECLHLSSLKSDDHNFFSYREILNLLLMSITTTDEPSRDSNSFNSINIHNNSNKGSAVNITNDDRDVSNSDNVIETNKSEGSNRDSNSNKSGRWDGNTN